MSDFNKTETVNHFYAELINRFFHPKSYFYICVNKFLEKSSLISHEADNSISQVLSQLVQYLNNSKQAAQELKEITQIKGFESLYSDLENQIDRHNLKHSDQPQLKKAIQNLALYLLRNIYHILLTNQNSRNTLTTYLDIKIKLKSILNGSNGKHSSKNLSISNEPQPNESLNDNFSPISNNPITTSESISFEANKNNTQLDNINILESYFETELTRLLEPLAIFSHKTSELPHNSDFVKQIYENFSQIEELARYHGYEEVEAIAGRVVQLMRTILSTKDSIDQKTIELLHDTKSVIEKHIFHHQSIDNLNNFLDSFDYHILNLKNQESSKKNEINEPINSTPSRNEEIVPLEINNSLNQDEISLDEPIEKNDPKSLTLLGSQFDNDENDDIDQLKLLQEDDEELLKLIQEIGTPKSSSSIENFSELEEDKSTETPINDFVQDNQQTEDEVEEASTYTIFQQEAALYYKILLDAVSQLKSEKNVQSALEDIELASSSLKQLAQKFGMEKIALLPELMESISILANKHIIKLPSLILQNIEDGVILLKEFNHHDNDHKTNFISILSSLKEYYSKILIDTKPISIAP